MKDDREREEEECGGNDEIDARHEGEDEGHDQPGDQQHIHAAGLGLGSAERRRRGTGPKGARQQHQRQDAEAAGDDQREQRRRDVPGIAHPGIGAAQRKLQRTTDHRRRENEQDQAGPEIGDTPGRWLLEIGGHELSVEKASDVGLAPGRADPAPILNSTLRSVGLGDAERRRIDRDAAPSSCSVQAKSDSSRANSSFAASPEAPEAS